MPKWGKHSDLIMLIVLIGGFIVGGVVVLWQWQRSMGDVMWETNFDKHSVPLEKIVSTGIGRDYRIVPIDNPIFHDADKAKMWLHSTSPVIVVTIDEVTRAYPLIVLLRHEIVNDHIGAEYFAVTYCPLCNSPIVFDRQVGDIVLRLGVSGNLYSGNFLMWDNHTESMWQQFTGIAIVGDYTGTELDIVPSQLVGFSTYTERFPDGVVLAGDAMQPDLNYNMNPYVGYDTSQSPLMNDAPMDKRLQPMERVLAATVDLTPVAYPFAILSTERVINDTIQGQPVVAFWEAGAASVLDAMSVEQSQDVGQAALFNRSLNGETLTFRYEDEHIYDNETNSEWNIFGEAIAGELAGERLERYNCFPHFWFAWSSAYPETLLYQS